MSKKRIPICLVSDVKNHKVNWNQPRRKMIVQRGELPTFFEETINIEEMLA